MPGLQMVSSVPGGCRRDCFPEEGKMRNYYCETYQKFFAESIGRLEYMAGHLV